jgi:hypothetical protein
MSGLAIHQFNKSHFLPLFSIHLLVSTEYFGTFYSGFLPKLSFLQFVCSSLLSKNGANKLYAHFVAFFSSFDSQIAVFPNFTLFVSLFFRLFSPSLLLQAVIAPCRLSCGLSFDTTLIHFGDVDTEKQIKHSFPFSFLLFFLSNLPLSLSKMLPLSLSCVGKLFY